MQFNRFIHKTGLVFLIFALLTTLFVPVHPAVSATVFTATGKVRDAAGNFVPDGFPVTVNNTTKSKTLTTTTGLRNPGEYFVTFTDFGGGSVADAADVLQFTVKNAAGEEQPLVEDSYTLTATDVSSAFAEVNLQIGEPLKIVNAGNSSVTVAPQTVVANGLASATITVTLRDDDNNPVRDCLVEITVTGTGNQFPAPPLTNAQGVTNTTLKSTKAESKTVTVTAKNTQSGDVVLPGVAVNFVPGPVDPAVSTVTANPTSGLVANNSDSSTITVTLMDANSNRVSGKQVQVTVSGSNNTITPNNGTGTTGSNGVLTFTVTTTTAETKTVTAKNTTDNITLSGQPQVTFGPGPVDLVKSQVDATSPVVANGSATSTVTVTLLDARDNPLRNKTVAVAIAASGSDNIVVQPGSQTDANGQVTGTVASTKAETKTITAKVSGNSLNDTATAVFGPGLPQTIEVTCVPNTLPADGASVATVTVTVTDEHDNRITSPAPTLQVTRGSITAPTLQAGGQWTATYTAGTTAGDAVLTAIVGTLVSSGHIITLTDVPPPVANNDDYEVDEDTTLTVNAPGVLDNDSPEGVSLTAHLDTDVSDGTLTLNDDGSFTYEPDADFNGTDTFTYFANDGVLDSNIATVTITVDPVNDEPVANDDAYSTNQDTTLTVDAPGVLDNDTDVEDDPLTAVLVTDVSNGTLTLNDDGSFTYDPNPGFVGEDSFTYNADDGNNGANPAAVSENPATVTITVTGDPNPIANDDSYSTNQDTTLTIAAPGVLANDTDPDGDDLTAVLDTDVSDGTLTLNDDGSFTYDPNAGFVGEDTFTYNADDGVATPAAISETPATVTITVNPVGGGWMADIIATSDNPEVGVQTVTFGMHPDASAGFDSEDVPAPPSPNPPVRLDAVFPLNDPQNPFITRLSTDKRGIADSETWTFQVRADLEGFTLSWDVSTQIPAEYSRVLLTPPSDPPVDMRSQNQYQIDQGNHTFTIQVDKTPPCIIQLGAGWNMISIPGTPVDPNPNSLVGPGSQILLPLFRWDPASFSYQPVTTLQLGEGYWILTLAPNGETLTINLQSPATTYTATLPAGWSMIGSVIASVDFTDPQDVPDGAILPPVFWWNPANFSYEPSNTIDPKKGYWVLSLQASTVTVTISPPPPPAAPSQPLAGNREPMSVFPISVESGEHRQQLSLGWDGTASNQLDRFDQVTPPVPPVQGYLDAHFETDSEARSQPLSLQRSVQPLVDGMTSQMRVTAETPIRLRWNRDALPNQFTLIALTPMGNVDFGATDSLSLPKGEHDISIRLQRRVVNLPTEPKVYPNFPNPFNPETWIPYQLSKASSVTLTIYNVEGETVRTVNLGLKPAGYYLTRDKAVYWDGRNQIGEQVASGIYFYKLEADNFTATRKMVILK